MSPGTGSAALLSTDGSTHVMGTVLMGNAPVNLSLSSTARHTGSCPSPYLCWNGGYAGGGITTQARVYIIWWGSQWNNNDPSGEAAIQTNFFNGVGGTSWNHSQSQYCEGVSSGTVNCGTSGTHVGNGTGMLAGTWYDNASAAPSSPTQSQIASEAVRAAAHFGNTTQTPNLNAEYVVSTATGNNQSGFAVQWCAYHSSTSSSYGQLSYTNMPYMTDGGASCGANFNGLGPDAGITIVGGHEFAESETDMYPNTGWLDSGGSETGDKCAWNSASGNITLSNGYVYPVQPLWSNTAGGCVMSG
jgi:serine protease